MRHLPACLTFLCAAAVGVGAQATSSQDAARKLKQLFGSEIRQASATPDPADDVRLARVLLDQAQKGPQDAAMTDAICQAVYGLVATAPEGQELAIEAMQLRAKHLPDQVADCHEKILTVRRRQYGQAKGDDRFPAGDALIAAMQDAAEAYTDAGRYADALRLLRQAAVVA